MLTVHCLAGHAVTGETAEQLLAGVHAHLNDVHPELSLPDGLIEDYVTAAVRMGAPRPRLTQITAPEVVPLTPELAETWLSFFDREGFTDNPAWASCYCMYYRFGGEQAGWQQRRAAENRADAAGLIATGGQSGFLAFVDGQPAGWLNAGRRDGYRGLPEAPDADGPEAAVTCFVIAPPYRRHGIARALLDAAVDRFRAEGYRRLLAYPALDADSAAAMYHGPLALYELAGFARLGEHGRQAILAKALT